ncbi:hypothetical protein PR048_021885 [Dryococelus australis]|uniref:Uncharacterized protein n=1 Tax=Dryococelus australis TaxID=614101 RepID=A0ABQ9GZQ6_9NEOP|nr:hypothetical protein PR048_021885 [Dryococelus australis]
MRVIEARTENRRNERAGGGTEDPRENPPTSGIVLHDSHMLKCGMRREHWRDLRLVAKAHLMREAVSSLSLRCASRRNNEQNNSLFYLFDGLPRAVGRNSGWEHSRHEWPATARPVPAAATRGVTVATTKTRLVAPAESRIKAPLMASARNFSLVDDPVGARSSAPRRVETTHRHRAGLLIEARLKIYFHRGWTIVEREYVKTVVRTANPSLVTCMPAYAPRPMWNFSQHAAAANQTPDTFAEPRAANRLLPVVAANGTDYSRMAARDRTHPVLFIRVGWTPVGTPRPRSRSKGTIRAIYAHLVSHSSYAQGIVSRSAWRNRLVHRLSAVQKVMGSNPSMFWSSPSPPSARLGVHGTFWIWPADVCKPRRTSDSRVWSLVRVLCQRSDERQRKSPAEVDPARMCTVKSDTDWRNYMQTDRYPRICRVRSSSHGLLDPRECNQQDVCRVKPRHLDGQSASEVLIKMAESDNCAQFAWPAMTLPSPMKTFLGAAANEVDACCRRMQMKAIAGRCIPSPPSPSRFYCTLLPDGADVILVACTIKTKQSRDFLRSGYQARRLRRKSASLTSSPAGNRTRHPPRQMRPPIAPGFPHRRKTTQIASGAQKFLPLPSLLLIKYLHIVCSGIFFSGRGKICAWRTRRGRSEIRDVASFQEAGSGPTSPFASAASALRLPTSGITDFACLSPYGLFRLMALILGIIGRCHSVIRSGNDVAMTRAAPECKGGGKREIPEKTRRPATSSGTIPTCENPGVNQPGNQPDSPNWEANRLTAQPPRRLTHLKTQPMHDVFVKSSAPSTSFRFSHSKPLSLAHRRSVARRVTIREGRTLRASAAGARWTARRCSAALVMDEK